MELKKEYATQELEIAATSLQIHLQSDLILKKAKIIAEELGIYSDTFYNGHHNMTSYIFVDTDIDRSVMCTVWFSTLYFLDDFFGEDVENIHEVPDLNYLFLAWTEGENFNWEQFSGKFRILCNAIAYCGQYIRDFSNTEFFKKYTLYLQEHLKHSLKPVNYKSMEEYIASRVHFGGMYPTVGMIEFSSNSYIKFSLLERSVSLQKAVKDCVLVGVLSNDLISYHKEKHSRQNLLNAYLETNEAVDIDNAIQKGISLINTSYRSFLQQKKVLNSQLNIFKEVEKESINNYLKGLERLISASYHWQVNTNRYRSSENIFTNLKELIVNT